LIFQLLVEGSADGLRIDHIDGLYEPMEYLRRLQRAYLVAMGKEVYRRDAAASKRPKAPLNESKPPWNDVEPTYLPLVTALTCTGRTAIPLYVIVEKILSGDESLPEQWLLSGTTGYDFLNSAAGLFVNPAGLTELTTIYQRFIDQHLDFNEIMHQSKLLIFRSAMISDLQLLAYRLNRISERHRRSRDFTFNSLRLALREILACFPVYRTYIHDSFVAERDRQVICRAAAQAKRRNRTINAAIFDFIRDVLLLECPPDLDEAGQRERELFVGRVQQVTSPVMAKGVEDTAFYRYFPLASLNEVGGDPVRGVTTVDEFHRHNLKRLAAWPQSLICTNTHDTKRGDDTRARISVLSEIPRQWRKAVNRWSRLNRRHRCEVDGKTAPSRNDEYLFYQSLIGVWPITPLGDKDLSALADRLASYMEKATHEAKIHTSWINPSTEYDAAIRNFVHGALANRGKNRFLEEFRRFHEQIVNWGLYTALSQVVLKLTSPGVPDIYQGEEQWRFSLVDPDNRRPVDFAAYAKTLARLRKDIGRNDRALLSVAQTLAQAPQDQRLKLFVTWRILQFRRQHPALFQLGGYIPLAIEGAKSKHLCAFARQSDTDAEADRRVAVVIVPRLLAELTRSPAEDTPPPPPLGPAVWQDTEIPLGPMGPLHLRNVFTGELYDAEHGSIRAAEALAAFPVALLTNDSPP
jgi:(1->4)-alpha-D-glucan 1-alpha-D-glucosylmutase